MPKVTENYFSVNVKVLLAIMMLNGIANEYRHLRT